VTLSRERRSAVPNWNMNLAGRVCARRKDAQHFAREVGGPYRRFTMVTTMNRAVALAVTALWSMPASASDLPPPSVYVAPGGVYIGSAQVYAGPGAGNGGQPNATPPGAAYGPPAFGPGYVVPAPAYAPTYAPPAVYPAPPPSVYGARPTVGVPADGSPYAAEFAPRPLAPVPYGRGNHCMFSYGRMLCD